MGGLTDFFPMLSQGLLGGAGEYFSGKATNEANAEQAALNRQFQERMSSTAYQRATADMSAAGLNPMLAYQQGSASSPGGSTAVMHNPMTSAISSALSIARTKAEVENIRAQTHKVKAETPGVEAESRRLQAVADDYPQWSREILKSERYLMAAKEDIARWNLSYEEKRLRISERLLDQKLPAEVRNEIASAVLKEVEAEFHPYKLIAPAVGAAATIGSAVGLRRLFGGRGAIPRGGARGSRVEPRLKRGVNERTGEIDNMRRFKRGY